MKYLILFDIDGTILKLKTYFSRKIFAKVLRDFFLKDIIIDVKDSFKGRTDLEILRRISIKNHIDFAEIEKNINIIWNKLLSNFKKYYTLENFRLIVGIDKFLKILYEDGSFLLGLQTGNFKQNAVEKLKVFGIDNYFSLGAFGSDFEDRRKLPLLAIERANEITKQNFFNEKNTLIFGDSEYDIICAKSNNLPIILVNSDNCIIDQSLLNYVNLIIKDFTNPSLLLKSIYTIFEKYEKN